ncbi:glycine oxidase ThiO [Aeromicrobium sp.]|uniref:glycine oxidase ThiO n=1 Tax=Aeromicrobium sp. TaxID=1871063 RepID=UPI0019C72FC1|nr:glycine oxidase ThiO [Aeromicrobium sp.]MBC7631508.1 glycine oxidase ThiO [Aeromicrobium sp.]
MNGSEDGQSVVVVGGGIVGLACADELVRAGHRVTLCDPSPGAGATYAAAGMLAPGGEAWFGEESLLRLGRESLARWPSFAAGLSERSGVDVDLRADGTLLVAGDRSDLEEVRRTCRLLSLAGVRVDELDRRDLKVKEPRLSSRVLGGAFLPDDHQVNPRRVVAALLAVLGDCVVRQRAVPTEDGVLLEDGTRLRADVVVLATGATGLPRVRPVRGEIVRVRTPDAPTCVLRARLHGERVYVVPRHDGELVIGATEEEHPAEQTAPMPTVGGVARLLETARALVPGLETAHVLEVVARDRPGSPDNGPLIGPVPVHGPARRLLAGGHHRGGVLLAPITAAAICAHVAEREVPHAARAFLPNRFDLSERDEDQCT